MPQVYFDNKIVALEVPVGEPGGEAIVYRLDDVRVAKIFHERSEAQSVRMKWALNQQIYQGFGSIASVPRGLIYSDPSQSEVAGYTMNYLDGYRPIIDILDSEEQWKLNVDLSILVKIFSRLHDSIKFCHQNGFFVGDLNARNIMVRYENRTELDVKLIDTDSWGYAGFETSWLPLAIDRDLEHPDLALNGLKEGQLRKRLYERDWYAYVLHLANALCGRHPFGTGTTKEGFSVAQRKAKGLTIWHRRVSSTRMDMVYSLRLGAKMTFLLSNWLNADARGEFPLEFLVSDFAENLVKCSGKYISSKSEKERQCRLEVHRSVRYCPMCMGKL